MSWPATKARRVLAALHELVGESNVNLALTGFWNERVGQITFSHSTMTLKSVQE